MADFPYKELATAYAAALTIGAGACFYLTTYQLYDPDFAFAAKCLKIYSSEFVRLPFRFIVTLMGIALGVALTQTIVTIQLFLNRRSARAAMRDSDRPSRRSNSQSTESFEYPGQALP
jgi:hypothetical protein